MEPSVHRGDLKNQRWGTNVPLASGNEIALICEETPLTTATLGQMPASIKNYKSM